MKYHFFIASTIIWTYGTHKKILYKKIRYKKCFRLELIIMTSKISSRHFSHFLVTISTHLFLIGGSERGLLLLTHDCTYKRRQIISFLGEVGQIWTFNCIPKQEKRTKRINNQPSLVFCLLLNPQRWYRLFQGHGWQPVVNFRVHFWSEI